MSLDVHLRVFQPQLDAELAKALAQARQALNAAPDCFLLLNRRGHVIFASELALLSLQCGSLDDVRGMDVAGLFAPEASTILKDMQARARKGALVHCDLALSAGALTTVAFLPVTRADGAVVCLCAVFCGPQTAQFETLASAGARGSEIRSGA